MASSSGAICRKRGNEGFISNEVCSPPKKISYFYILEPESDVHSEDGTESIHSIQDKSTDCAKDTSDTSDTPDESDDSQSEYEVASLDYREQGNPIDHEKSSSSGTDEVNYILPYLKPICCVHKQYLFYK
uniref:Uncharacterized protein n=1 Tax=Clastoptera arizonana TaxID=38151 RepID=A0A1B6CTP4_9HEMI